MFVVMSVGTDSRAVNSAAGLIVGGTVTLNAILAGALTGASTNPARSLGPAWISFNFHNLWPYLVVPILGTTLGAMTYKALKSN